MFKFGKRGQTSIYVEEDLQPEFIEFAEQHPYASASHIMNAALRVYLPLAKQYGVNGRYLPLLPEHDGPSSTQTMHGIMQQLSTRYGELIGKYEDLMRKYESQRRIVWTEEQRRAFRNEAPQVSAQASTRVSSRRNTK